MQTISQDVFLHRLAERGIIPDPQFPRLEHLIFRMNQDDLRYWEYPDEASKVPHFINAVVKAIGADQRYWIYPRCGAWSLGADAAAWPQSQIWRVLLRSMGIPDGFIGAVAMDPEERDSLLALLFLQVTLGPSAHIDTLVIPDAGDALIFFEHHEVVHMRFRDSERLLDAITVMEGAGYPLPSGPPDETFKPLPWKA